MRREKTWMIGWARLVAGCLVCFAVTLVLLPFHLAFLWLDHPLARRLPRLWHRIMRRVLGVRIECRGRLAAERPLMLVCNHASWLDIVVLASLADVAFIAKAEVRDWPLFGWLARWQRSVFVDRAARNTTARQVDAIAERLDRGEIVVLFAEGTTSDGNRVLDFKSSLFGAARTAAARSHMGAVTLQPVTLAYTRVHGLAMGLSHRPLASWPGDVDLLPHLTEVLKSGAIDMTVTFGEAIPFDAASDRKAVSRKLNLDMRRTLAETLRQG